MTVEFWTMGAGVPVRSASGANLGGGSIDGVQMAVQAEMLGYDGIVWVDSQNLAPDCYISMALAAHATSRIQLGTGVTNSYTRHAAVTASCIATIQAESQGRAHMGIGRGDSALAHLGLAPHGVASRSSAISRNSRPTCAATASSSETPTSTRSASPTPPRPATSAISTPWDPRCPSMSPPPDRA